MFRALNRVFDYSGRSTRWEYWSFSIGFAIILLVAGAWVDNYQKTHFGLMPQFSPDQETGLGFAILIFLAAPNLSLRVRRYHDFGWSGWAVLWTFVPVANVFMEFMLLFRGSAPEPVVYQAPAEPQQIAIYNTAPAPVAAAHVPHALNVDQIARLADLHAQGALTAQEFAAAKAKLLRS